MFNILNFKIYFINSELVVDHTPREEEREDH